MITKQELQQAAKKKSMKDISLMEKDYALTWTLNAIYANKELSNALIFKGGTCLSKIYGENYRLSEDLDFSTPINLKPPTEWFEGHLSAAFEEAKSQGAPELKVKKEEIHSNSGQIVFQVSYNAVLGQAGRLKLDISLKEHIMCGIKELPLREKIYSDVPDFKARCYALQEIALEKMRALFQRGKSRDYYDLWQIFTNISLHKQVALDDKWLRKYLVEKCEYSKVDYKPESIFSQVQLEEARRYWKDALGRMVSKLPDFELVISELKDTFFEESELSEFNNEIDSESSILPEIILEHLDNINRAEDNGGALIYRALDLLLQKMALQIKM